MRARRSLPQDSVGVFRDVFDLHTWHGAILALMAPKRKCEEFGGGATVTSSLVPAHSISSPQL